MRLIPVVQPRFDQSRDLMMLDDAEMALQMNDLAVAEAAPQPKRPLAAQRPAAPVMHLSDFLTELYAAASLIMDRAECDALAHEMMARRELVLAA